MKTKLKTNCSIVRIVRLFDCGRVVRSIIAAALCAVGLTAFAEEPEISAVSAEGWLDLTAGDRVAKAEETLVVDPAWGEAASATVKIDGEAGARTYMCASNDLWQTTSLTPGRYAMALTAGMLVGDDAYTAAFWKIGDGWVVFDGSNITSDVTFEAGATYLMLGTNTVADGVTLTVTDRAKFEYGAGAGFLGGTVAELPKRYAKVDVEGGLYQIVEKIKGSKDNPWDAGGDASQPENVVEAYTNGTALVFAGKGTITDLSEIPAGVKGGIAAITIAAGVTDAAAGAFYGFGSDDATIALTLPGNWQGELPDEKGNWRGAKGAELTAYPMSVKNVKPQQRYPWNGLVDVDFDLTGEGNVKVALSVTVDGKKLKNPTVTGATTFDLGDGKELKDLRITWDAKTDFGDEEKHEKIKVKLTVEKAEAD